MISRFNTTIQRASAFGVAALIVFATMLIPAGAEAFAKSTTRNARIEAGEVADAQFAQQLVNRSIRFEPSNDGTFIARGSGYMAQFAADGVTLALASSALKAPAKTPGATIDTAETSFVKMTFENANATPRIQGLDKVAGKTNYLMGDNPSAWRTNVESFAKLRYTDVYPGVDVVFYDNQGQLEYDFVVAPGADAHGISIAFEGADSLEVENGELLVHSATGVLRQSVPAIHQDGANGKEMVAGGFALNGSRSARFDLGNFDASRALTIDPVLTYASYVGGSGWDAAQGVAIDRDGYVYVTGVSRSADFPIRNQVMGLQGAEDVVVLKFDPLVSGDASLVSSTYIGGSSLDCPFSLKIDGDDSIYLAGYTASTNFPTVNAFQADPGDSEHDAFLIRVNKELTTIEYSTYLGGVADDRALCLTVSSDGSGVACVGGYCGSAFPLRNEIETYQAGADAFVTEINTEMVGASSLMMSTYLGGVSHEWASGVTMDSTGNIFVVGETWSTNFPVQNPLNPMSDEGQGNGFVTKISPLGGSMQFSTYLGGSMNDCAYGITTDATGKVYVVGRTASSTFPVVNGYKSTFGGGEYDGYLMVLDPTGTTVLYSTYVGGSDDDGLGSVALDSANNVYVSGWAKSSNYPTRNATQAFGGNYDAVVSRFNIAASGDSSLTFSTYVGGNGVEHVNAMTVDSHRNIFLVGDTSSVNFPTVGGYQGSLSGNYDLFFAKISQVANTIGVYASSNFFLRNAHTAGIADLVFSFGVGGTPLAGDWDGDGKDTIGLYIPLTGTFFLRNANTNGGADLAFTFGPILSTMTPVVGDWNGDGVDTIGLYDPATGAFFLKNTNSGGSANIVFTYGPGGLGWKPVVGDWNGDNIDTVGLYSPATGSFYLRNSNTPGNADISFNFGPANVTPIAGDWNGDGKDTIGVHIPATGAWFLRNQNTAGMADLTFTFGPVGATPLTGDWDGM